MPIKNFHSRNGNFLDDYYKDDLGIISLVKVLQFL